MSICFSIAQHKQFPPEGLALASFQKDCDELAVMRQLSTKHNDLLSIVLCNTRPWKSDCVITASNEGSKPAASPWIQSPDEPLHPEPLTDMQWPKNRSQKAFLTPQQPMRAIHPQLCLTFLLGSLNWAARPIASCKTCIS